MRRTPSVFRLIACLLILGLIISVQNSPSSPQTSSAGVIAEQTDAAQTETAEPSPVQAAVACVLVILLIIILLSVLGPAENHDSS